LTWWRSASHAARLTTGAKAERDAEMDALVAQVDEAGLIEISDEDGHQVIRLTPDGARVAR
jgi:hypothetical protein